MKKALIVGINDYPGAPLSCCINDATNVADLLNFNGDGSNNFEIILSTQIRTQVELRSAIIKLFEGDCDTALFYFSGHGHINQFGGYLLTPDVKLHNEGVPMDDVMKLANESLIRNKIIILDCCHAGAVANSHGKNGTLTHLADGVTILTASREQEKAVEVNGHGLFTSLLLDGLIGGAADITGNITPGSLYTYIDKALGAWHQRPVFKTNVSRFISLRNIEPLIPIQILRKITEYFPTPGMPFNLDKTYEFTNEGVAIPAHIEIFKHLQKMEGVGLVEPVGEEHMYFAAQNEQACRLTPIGHSYWRLVKEQKV